MSSHQTPEYKKLYAELVITKENKAEHDAYCQHQNVELITWTTLSGPRTHIGRCDDCGLRVFRAAHRPSSYGPEYDHWRACAVQYFPRKSHELWRPDKIQQLSFKFRDMIETITRRALQAEGISENENVAIACAEAFDWFHKTISVALTSSEAMQSVASRETKKP